MKCPNPKCGKNIQNPKKFCPYCRNPLVVSVQLRQKTIKKLTIISVTIIVIVVIIINLPVLHKPVEKAPTPSVAPEATIASTPEPTLAATTPVSTEKFTEPYTGMEFALVKHGCFKMGNTFAANEGGDDEKPHDVCITKDFYMGKHEVTQGQWVKVMGTNPSNFQNGENYPVEKVSWSNARDFIDKLNARGGGKYRLPTEAEWEYACREGGRKVRFGTGEDRISPSTANFDASSAYKQPYSDVGEYRMKTTPVSSFKPNGLGLYDMSGNVWEWVADVYDKDAYNKLGENDPIYTGTGNSGSYRVLRGGSWHYSPDYLRCSNRHILAPTVRISDVGFRLVKDR